MGWCAVLSNGKKKKKIDSDIDFVDNVGNIIRSFATTKDVVKVESMGEELPNIIKYIIDAANGSNVSVPKLWLDRIPDFIYIEDLKKKYGYKVDNTDVNLVIGEYDDPDNQSQSILTLSLINDGNTIIYGSTGSGKELLISSIIYSSITNYNPDEVNLYIIDFGAETLKMFEKAPQVGNVLYSDDNERIENLFKMLSSILDDRKKLFADYNGSYSFYKEHSNKKIPIITVIINNYEAFNEAYDEEYEDIVLQLTREGSKYGVVFILSTNSTNSIRYKLKQNFRKNLSLQFNDTSDYSDVIPGVGKKIPSKVYGRGLIELDGVFEFQTAYPYKSEKLSEYIKLISKRLRSICKTYAPKIPVLPEIVSIDDVDENISSLSAIPIGISKNTLDIIPFNYKDNGVSLVSALDIYEGREFYKCLISIIGKVSNNIIVIDAIKMLNKEDVSGKYINTNFDSIITDINTNYLKQKEIYEKSNYDEQSLNEFSENVYIIFGISNLISRISEDNKTNFYNALSSSKEYGKDKFIIIDTTDKLKDFNYDDWYKSAVDDSQGVWIGNGISDQYTFKLLTTPRELREEIDEGFGYVVTNGKATLVKLVQRKDDSNG